MSAPPEGLEKGGGGEERDPRVALLLAWLVPGLGHLYLGKRFKGIGFFVLLSATYATGVIISQGLSVSWEHHSYAFIAQIGAGLYTLLTAAWTRFQGNVRIPEHTVPYMDTGLLYTMVAGLLNFLVIHDVVDAPRSPEEDGSDEDEPGAGEGATAAAADPAKAKTEGR